MKILRKLFGGIDLTWPKLILFAVAAGVYTAAVAIIPGLLYTSFHTIAVTFEAWILFGETLSPIQLVGMAVAVLGVVLASRK